jgi:hypothetical protein
VLHTPSPRQIQRDKPGNTNRKVEHEDTYICFPLLLADGKSVACSRGGEFTHTDCPHDIKMMMPVCFSTKFLFSNWHCISFEFV